MAGVFALEVARALSLLPRVPAVLTAAFEHKRSGILVDRVMACADEPPAVAVALLKGHRLSTLVRDSHCFSVNIIDPKDRLLVKKFGGGSEADAFELLESRQVVTGAPCLTRASACLDCDVMRHFDLEADYEIYVGLIVGVWLPASGEMVANPSGQYAAALLGSPSIPTPPAGRPTWSGNGHGVTTNGYHAHGNGSFKPTEVGGAAS